MIRRRLKAAKHHSFQEAYTSQGTAQTPLGKGVIEGRHQRAALKGADKQRPEGANKQRCYPAPINSVAHERRQTASLTSAGKQRRSRAPANSVAHERRQTASLTSAGK